MLRLDPLCEWSASLPDNHVDPAQKCTRTLNFFDGGTSF
jgi:hypothetical protein